MSKYDWSNVPVDVESIATNSDGEVRGFESDSPTLCSNKFRGEFTSNYGYYNLINQKPYKGDWRESLEKRPK